MRFFFLFLRILESRGSSPFSSLCSDEFKLHGLQDVITIRHSNVYKDGFGGLEDVVDSGAFFSSHSCARKADLARPQSSSICRHPGRLWRKRSRQCGCALPLTPSPFNLRSR